MGSSRGTKCKTILIATEKYLFNLILKEQRMRTGVKRQSPLQFDHRSLFTSFTTCKSGIGIHTDIYINLFS